MPTLNININEKANLMRLDCILEKTKDAVVQKDKQYRKYY